MPSRSQLWLAKKKKDNSCLDCSAPLNGDTRLKCLACRTKQTVKELERAEIRHKFGLCRRCGKDQHGLNSPHCMKCRTYAARNARTLRDIVLAGYGGDTPHCQHCFEANPLVLEIDHIANEGGKDRRKGVIGARWYRVIIKNNFPSDYQILCRNCNWLKHRLGGQLPPPEPIPLGVCCAHSS